MQFQSIVSLPIGEIRYFHLAAVLMLLLNVTSMRATVAVLGELRVMVVAILTLTILAIVSALSYDGGVAQPVQHIFYCGVGIAFVVTLRNAVRHESGRALLIWASPITVAVTLGELLQRTVENGLDPGVVLRTTLLELDTNLLIFGVFRQGLATGDVVQPANIRHEIMAAVVVAVLVTMLAGHVRRATRVVAAVSSAVGAGLVILSLSRSILLPLVIVALGVGIRALLRSTLTKASAAGVLMLMIISPVAGPLLYARFVEDTGSYEYRLGAFSYSADELLSRVVGGGAPIERAEDSTHTLVFDLLFQAGWLAGLAAAVIVVVFAKYTVTAYARYFRSGSLLDFVPFTAGTLAIVRAFTIGGGYLHQVEWIEFGILVALVAGVGARRPVDELGSARTLPAPPIVRLSDRSPPRYGSASTTTTSATTW